MLSRRFVLWYFGTFLVVICGFSAFAFRPVPITGFTADDLAVSVNGGGPFSGAYRPCRESDHGDAWVCEVSDSEGSSGATYTVGDPTWWGCWSAERSGPGDPQAGLPRTLEGCITLLDRF